MLLEDLIELWLSLIPWLTLRRDGLYLSDFALRKYLQEYYEEKQKEQ
jgi:hypothetical protein